MQEIEQQPSNVQGIRSDRTALNNLMAAHHNTIVSSNNHGAVSGTPQASIALTSYQNMLMRQNSMNQTQSSSPTPNPNPSMSLNNSLQQETPCFSNSTQSPSSMKQLGNNVSGYSSSQLPPHQLTQQQRLQLQQQLGSANNPSAAHQQLFQEMSNNGGSRGAGTGTGHQQHSVSIVGLGNNSPQPSTSNVSSGAMSRNNSFKETVASNGDSLGPAAVGTNRLNSRTQDISLPQDDIISDIVQEFTDSGFFSGDFDDAIMGFNWK